MINLFKKKLYFYIKVNLQGFGIMSIFNPLILFLEVQLLCNFIDFQN